MEMQKRMTAGVIVLAVGAALSALSCGGKQSVASKSAAAYREAVAKGVPIGSGHGGHTADMTATSAGHDGMAGMDHSQMPGMTTGTATAGQHDMSSMGHSRTQHGSAKGMSNMPGMQHGSMAGMDHSKTQHGSTGAMANMPGMQHGSTAGMSNMPGMQHGARAVAPVPSAPTNSSGIAQLNPAATLSPDSFDQPAPIAVSEANKSSSQTKPPDHSHHGGNSNGE